MSEDKSLRERVTALETSNTELRARVATLENQHVFGVAQMDRIEEIQKSILTEVARIMPTQELLDGIAEKLNAIADKAEAAAGQPLPK